MRRKGYTEDQILNYFGYGSDHEDEPVVNPDVSATTHPIRVCTDQYSNIDRLQNTSSWTTNLEDFLDSRLALLLQRHSSYRSLFILHLCDIHLSSPLRLSGLVSIRSDSSKGEFSLLLRSHFSWVSLSLELLRDHEDTVLIRSSLTRFNR